MQPGYPGAAQPGYPQPQPGFSGYAGQMPSGYQAAPQYPAGAAGALVQPGWPGQPGQPAEPGWPGGQAGWSGSQPGPQPGWSGQPGMPAEAPVQPSYAAGAQQQPFPLGPGDVNVQLPPNGTPHHFTKCLVLAISYFSTLSDSIICFHFPFGFCCAAVMCILELLTV